MLLKNTKARLVTINGPYANGVRTVKYQILPGDNPAVEVPDRLCKSAFVQSLIKDGTLIVLSGGSADDDSEDGETTNYLKMKLDDLKVLCENRGIELAAKETVKTLAVKLKAKDAEEAAAE